MSGQRGGWEDEDSAASGWNDDWQSLDSSAGDSWDSPTSSNGAAGPWGGGTTQWDGSATYGEQTAPTGGSWEQQDWGFGSEPFAEQPQGGKRRGGKGVLIALLVLIGLVVVGGGGFAAWKAFGPGSDSLSAIKKCDSPPDFATSSFSDKPDGALEIAFRATPTCERTDVLDGRATRINVYRVDNGALTKTAEGIFDFSQQPLKIDERGSDVTLTFPHETVHMSRSEMTGGEKFVTEVLDGRNEGGSGQAPADGSIASSSTSATSASTASSSSTSATSTSVKPEACTNSSALTDLESRRTKDKSRISDRLVGKWVPQISSKQVGLTAEGKTWDACAILDELKRNTNKYPDVALAWTNDWSSFDLQDWWVTVVGLPYTDAETALSWCRNNGFDSDHCYAKKIRETGGSEGTSRYNR